MIISDIALPRFVTASLHSETQPAGNRRDFSLETGRLGKQATEDCALALQLRGGYRAFPLSE
jgi:hypothetical protein